MAEMTTTVTLRIFAPGLNPEEISRELGVEPDHSHFQGEYPHNNPKYSIYKHGMWSLDSKLPAEEEFEAHLNNVLSAIESKKDYIHRLSEYCTVDFYCVLYDQTAFQLSAQTLKRVAELGATLGVKCYPPDENDEEKAEEKDS